MERWDVAEVSSAARVMAEVTRVGAPIADFAVSRDEWLAGEVRLLASYELV